jgi:hypothetical protein
LLFISFRILVSLYDKVKKRNNKPEPVLTISDLKQAPKNIFKQLGVRPMGLMEVFAHNQQLLAELEPDQGQEVGSAIPATPQASWVGRNKVILPTEQQSSEITEMVEPSVSGRIANGRRKGVVKDILIEQVQCFCCL